MGKKGKWLSSLKKAFSPDSKEKKIQKNKEQFLEKHVDLAPSDSNVAALEAVNLSPPQPEEVNFIESKAESSEATYPLEADTDDAVAAPSAPVQDVVRRQLNTGARFAGKSNEEAAAIRIQTAFRAYLAKRALRALRGLVRLKTMMEGPVVKRQAAGTLKCMQTLSRVQCQIRMRRIRMTEENQALQRQILQKHAKEIVNLQMGEDWDDSLQSKEQIEASLLSKHEAAMRREKAMAYSFTHQKTWKNGSKSMNPLFMDLNNPSWGWSWLERWMAARPWESRGLAEKEQNDQSSVKSGRSSIGGEISKAYARYQLNSDKQSPKASQTPSLQSHSTPKQASTPARKLKSPSPRSIVVGQDDDTRSTMSMQSERNRRHTISGSFVRDDESLASSPSLPSYMVPTQSARARTRLQSPLGLESNGTTTTTTTTTPEKGSIPSTKKRLSFPPSPASKPRRHSGPPKVDINSNANTEVAVVNGDGN